MTVTKNVIRDLMPLYVAGEASADSRKLVEQFLRENPGETPLTDAPDRLPEVAVPERLEMASLDQTRHLYHRRTTALAWAFAASFAVFSFRFGDKGTNWIVFRDFPEVSWALLAVASVIWLAFFALERRWASTGLAPASASSKLVWMAGGALATLPYAVVLSHTYGWDDVRALCVVGAFAGAAIGAGLHRRQ